MGPQPIGLTLVPVRAGFDPVGALNAGLKAFFSQPLTAFGPRFVEFYNPIGIEQSLHFLTQSLRGGITGKRLSVLQSSQLLVDERLFVAIDVIAQIETMAGSQARYADPRIRICLV